MISLNNITTMHEILSQVMESKRQVRIFVDGKPFIGHVVSLSSQFVELDDSTYYSHKPKNQIVICINSIKVISIYPKEDEDGGKK